MRNSTASFDGKCTYSEPGLRPTTAVMSRVVVAWKPLRAKHNTADDSSARATAEVSSPQNSAGTVSGPRLVVSSIAAATGCLPPPRFFSGIAALPSEGDDSGLTRPGLAVMVTVRSVSRREDAAQRSTMLEDGRDGTAESRARRLLLPRMPEVARRAAVGVGLLHRAGRGDRRPRRHRGRRRSPGSAFGPRVPARRAPARRVHARPPRPRAR